MKVRTRIYLTSIDIVLLFISFSLAVMIKPNSGYHYFIDYSGALPVFVLIWILISTLSRKLNAGRYNDLRQLHTNIIITNLIILSVSALAMYTIRSLEYSRFIVFGTIIITTMLELVLAYFYFYLKHAKTGRNGSTSYRNYASIISGNGEEEKTPLTIEEKHHHSGENIDQMLIAETGKEVYDFLDRQMDLSNGNHIVFSTTTKFNIERLPKEHYSNIVNLKRINDIRYINKFFEAVNSRIPQNGIFVGCAETKNQRKQRILRKYPPVINILIYIIDFIVKRIFPKFAITKQIYFFLTRGNNRVISRAETLGRLYSCGFEITDKKEINGNFYFAVKKTDQPAFDENPTYGPFIKLPRIGKDGKMMQVYKLRTMHPFSEYIQDYIFSRHSLQNGGKFNNDFRITTLGKIFRKFWLDEIPMLINFFKGELKLVGVRPLSEHYFNLYDENHQRKRIQYKPGLIPPFYADLPETLEEIQESERRYLDAYERHPLLTDWNYFWKAFFNIIFRRKRSS
jgi:lipopolysaccharide/colanic/teichoic acid biosynthesis glycosyltransferase